MGARNTVAIALGTAALAFGAVVLGLATLISLIEEERK